MPAGSVFAVRSLPRHRTCCLVCLHASITIGNDRRAPTGQSLRNLLIRCTLASPFGAQLWIGRDMLKSRACGEAFRTSSRCTDDSNEAVTMAATPNDFFKVAVHKCPQSQRPISHTITSIIDRSTGNFPKFQTYQSCIQNRPGSRYLMPQAPAKSTALAPFSVRVRRRMPVA